MLPYVELLKNEYRKMGYIKSEVERIEYVSIDDCYCLMKAYLKMEFELTEIKNIRATFLLKLENNKWKNIVQIDHEDLFNRVKSAINDMRSGG
jgi:hypothetical protein